jgi:hypothetical protein
MILFVCNFYALVCEGKMIALFYHLVKEIKLITRIIPFPRVGEGLGIGAEYRTSLVSKFGRMGGTTIILYDSQN